MSYARKLFLFLVLAAVLVFLGMVFFRQRERTAAIPLPPAVGYNAASTSQPDDPASAVVDPVLPAEINLAVPFTTQAPHQNWDLPYQEFCEEASILMAAGYVRGEAISGPDDADKKMFAIKDFEEKRLGFYKDTTAEETALVLKEYFELPKVEIVFDPTEEIIKKALAGRKVVVVPAAGRELKNPHYKQPGPLYHMLVVKGYTKEGDFITNDPGTRSGADYVYKPGALLNAVHDWNNGDVYTGKKVAIIVG